MSSEGTVILNWTAEVTEQFDREAGEGFTEIILRCGDIEVHRYRTISWCETVNEYAEEAVRDWLTSRG